MKIFFPFIALVFILVACGKTQPAGVQIAGEIAGLDSATIYLYGIDEAFDGIDTIVVRQGKFSHYVDVDTAVTTFLLFADGTEYPLFIDGKNRITVQGDTANLASLTVTGNIHNDDLTAVNAQLSDTLTGAQYRARVRTFIGEHPQSLASLYLLRQYFVSQDTIDRQSVKDLTAKLTGFLQDNPFVEQLNDYLANVEKSEEGRYAPFFSLPNAAGEKITRSTDGLRSRYLLIHFWASWAGDSISRTKAVREWRNIYRKYRKNKDFAMLGISLDIDREQWRAAVKRDTLEWEQVIDIAGMNAETARNFAIRRLPANILLATDGRILHRNITGQALADTLRNRLARK
jgi:hypothetical protein